MAAAPAVFHQAKTIGLSALLVATLICGAAAQNSTNSTPPTEPPTKVCYDGLLGCFENFFPFNNTFGRLPNPPELVGTRILLFQRKTQNGQGEELSYSDVSTVKQSSFSARLPVKVIIHGFSQNESVEWMHVMKNALLRLADVNVIIVGWGKGAEAPNYLQAAANTRIVGRQIAQLLRLLVSVGSSYSKMHLIGHSLGAHTSGYIGTELKGQLKRISGLDPAEPSFEFKDPIVRLDASDAHFVDVIHSNGAPIVEGGAGLKQPSGHVDFYPNGGDYQPGCPNLLAGGLGALLKGDLSGAAAVASCNHNRAIWFFIESINSENCDFTAFPCPGEYPDFVAGRCLSCAPEGCSVMGYNADAYSARGSFYLVTAGAPNYCRGTSTAVTIEMATAITVTGAIKLLISDRHETYTVDITGSNDKITGSTTKILPVPVEASGIQGVSIAYKKYGGLFLGIGAGPQSWSLTKVTIQSDKGSRVTFCSPKSLNDGEELQLIRCKSST